LRKNQAMDWIRTLAGLYLTSLHILAGNPSLPTSHPATAVHFRRAEPQAKPAPEVQAAIDRLDQATKSWLADKRLEALRLAEGALPTLRTSAPASDKLISCLNLLGKLNVQQNPKAARPYFDEAFRLENSRPSINLVDTLIGFGNLAEDQGDFPAAEQWYSKARDAARGAKKTHAEGAAWVELGNTHRKQFKYAQAIQDYKHARELASGRPMDIEDCDNNIGLAEFEEGDLTDARVDFSRVLDERKRLDITGIQVANSLVNLSLVEFQYGDLVQSSSYLNEAEKIYRKVDPNSAVMAVILNDRGNVEMEKGDYVAAEADYRSALAMDRAVQEKSTDVASDLMSVSHVLQEEATLRPDARGSFAPPQARRKADQDRQHLVDGALRAVNGALEIVPGNPTALTLKAEVFGIEHQFEDAKRNLRLAIGAIEPAAPNSLDLANCYGDLGSIEAENGELPAAEADFAKAYAVCSHAPNTLRGC
jgi:tetratricopeptide (TPR) repeat protein